MTINKTFHPTANEAVTYAVDKVLVTVYFSVETEFEIWTVKNGGVNGDADTEKQKGAFFFISIIKIPIRIIFMKNTTMLPSILHAPPDNNVFT